ncbi:2-C-methyl-D-erythritol 2,4-cyclodiphosphate synthase [Fastidiosibacter lacustris]|uniref:2-C-methyl-D-erythritol 2,4-cyclodiphosphate synthase n=1 Tax=Fastidiosibacter lacustris TaxID=2056695 RepID=UPI000E351C30|nr:2-C-methyl-D-erythritol 2,4-cyclodiphosphate synthase [Fastidiosibacter lacustris]
MFRIGHGYDVHKISTQNKPLILAGIEVLAPFSLEAHSDGDIVLHALTDALLGAAALGDIGQHFPDTDPAHKNRASKDFLLHAQKNVVSLGYQISNIDITVVAQVPKLAPYINEMCQSIASLLQLKLNQVNIKATTTEKLGFIGRKEGLACYAVALIYQP